MALTVTDSTGRPAVPHSLHSTGCARECIFGGRQSAMASVSTVERAPESRPEGFQVTRRQRRMSAPAPYVSRALLTTASAFLVRTSSGSGDGWKHDRRSGAGPSHENPRVRSVDHFARKAIEHEWTRSRCLTCCRLSFRPRGSRLLSLVTPQPAVSHENPARSELRRRRARRDRPSLLDAGFRHRYTLPSATNRRADGPPR
jgi:hypothetical protein